MVETLEIETVSGTLIERVDTCLRDYCKIWNNEEEFEVRVIHNLDEVRAIVHSPRFDMIIDRQCDVWSFLRNNLSADDLLMISAIQTLGMEEPEYAWRDDS